MIEIGATAGSDHKRHDSFIRFAMRNLSFAYICMFLDLFGFAYVQFRKSVHKNDSKTLDKLWRENLTTARTSKANKTNYSKMSVVLVYWGGALREPPPECVSRDTHPALDKYACGLGFPHRAAQQLDQSLCEGTRHEGTDSKVHQPRQLHSLCESRPAGHGAKGAGRPRRISKAHPNHQGPAQRVSAR